MKNKNFQLFRKMKHKKKYNSSDQCLPANLERCLRQSTEKRKLETRCIPFVYRGEPSNSVSLQVHKLNASKIITLFTIVNTLNYLQLKQKTHMIAGKVFNSRVNMDSQIQLTMN